MSRYVGITVLGDFILSEGVEPVLDNVTAAGATAVALNPTVTAESAEGEGSFQPPDDAGSSPRLFDRPLFGKRSLWVQSEISYRPEPGLYAESAYTRGHPAIDRDARGTDRRVHFCRKAAGPGRVPAVARRATVGVGDEDGPRRPTADSRGEDGRTASLASPASGTGTAVTPPTCCGSIRR
ncbi:MAG: hypothetical protein Ct9H300mP1_26410 [Planctomycetaceae bacterium]|nr:MAG: hypothetical protein Ct9H300mP1_26410 [Planctomycetaceae bacterium]